MFENIKNKMNKKKSTFPGFPGTNNSPSELPCKEIYTNGKISTIEQVFNPEPKSRLTKYVCEPCEFTCKRRCDWDEHIITRKHQIRTNPDKDLQKTYTCEACNFNCTKLSKWNSHIETQRHKKQSNINNETKIGCQYCGLMYTSRSGLWYHQQKCGQKVIRKPHIEDESDEKCDEEYDNEEDEKEVKKPQQNNVITPELMMMEMQETVIEKKETRNIIHNNTPQYYCCVCNIDCYKKNNYDMHLATKKHKNNENGMAIVKKDGVFHCEDCDLVFVHKRNLQAHLTTQKHLKRTNQIIKEEDKEQQEDNQCIHCGKEFKSRSGLWKHIEKTHKEENENDKKYDNESHDKEIQQNLAMLMTPEIIAFLIQQNKSVQEMVLEQNKTIIEIVKNMGNITNNNNSHNTTNNIQNNKSFNLNVFLNETCKDVMNQLEVHERDIHCTDTKRETIYIKDNDKCDNQKTKVVSVIKQVGAKNIKMIPEWCKEQHGWNGVDSKENDRYLKYVFNSMCGGTDEEINKNYGDISRYISKITVVDKKEAIEL